jgi:hypothetical protein
MGWDGVRRSVAWPGALALACGGTEVLPFDAGGAPLWEDIVVDPIDLGGAVGPIAPEDRRAPGPITLRDVTIESGLGGVTGGGNQHGVGVLFTDLDGDERPDIVVVNGLSNVTAEWTESRHLRNRGDGTFEDVGATSGIVDAIAGLDGYSVAAGDVDNDGDIDVYVGAQTRDVLLRNRGDGSFEDATAPSGAGGPPSDFGQVGDGRGKIVTVGDWDGDGWLDLAAASSTLPAPGAYLLRNRGDGTFEDVTAQSGIAIDGTGNPCAVMWSDHDNDGDRDLWIWNDRGGHILLENQGTTLADVTAASELAAVPQDDPMGIDAADIDHDGDLDFYLSNIGDNPLLRNNGDGTFVDITRDAGTGGDYGWGLVLEDFDHDGWADIFVAQEDDRPHLVFRNDGADPPHFTRIDVPHPPISSVGAAHNVAVAAADYDADGRTDVLVAGTDGRPVVLYRNETDPGSGVGLSVVARAPADAGEASDGIGARVVVKTGELVQFRDVTGGSSRASQNELSVRLGLGDFRGAEWVAVVWPNGRQVLATNVEGGTRVVLPP